MLSKTTFEILLSNPGNGFSVSSDFAVVNNNSLANTSSSRIVYSSATGTLFYNQNGAENGFGSGGQFAVLANKPALARADFIITT